MTRALLAIVLCVSLGCGHRRVATIGGTMTLGAIGVGLPLAHECTPEVAGDCGVAHAVPYLVVGALAGALLGIWVLYEVEQAEHKAATAKPRSPTRAVP